MKDCENENALVNLRFLLKLEQSCAQTTQKTLIHKTYNTNILVGWGGWLVVESALLLQILDMYLKRVKKAKQI